MSTLEAMKIKLSAEQGPVLTSRGRAAALRASVEDAIRGGAEVVLDFDGVMTMSPSFADELLAKLDPHAVKSGRLRIEHFPASVKPLARYLAENRHTTEVA